MLTQGLTSLYLLAVMVLIQGCGLIFGGTKQTVFIESVPPQATFRISNAGIMGTTPATVELKRKESYTVVVEKDGYKPKGETIENRVSWLPVIGDICIAWPTVFVDILTGGAFELRPTQLFFELEKQ